MISVIFDTETTGLLLPSKVPIEKQPRIIEVACLVCDGSKIIGSYSQLVFPGIKLPPIITKITGIKDEDLEGAPTWQTVLPMVVQYFSQADAAVAHNLDFDYNMFNNEAKRAGVESFPWPKRLICTIQAYEHLFGRWLKQGELYQYFMGKTQEKAHRALDDVLALHECLVAAKFFEELDA